MSQLESTLERRTVKWAKTKLGAMSIKLQGAGNKGMPDRLFLLPPGITAFVEFKREGEVARLLQTVQINKLRARGFYAEVFDNDESVRQWLCAIAGVDPAGLSSRGLELPPD